MKHLCSLILKRGAYHWEAHSRNIFKHHLFTATRYETVHNLAKITPGESICDFGCGDGALTFLLKKTAFTGRVVGVEPEPTGRALALRMLAANLSDVEVLASSSALPPGTFDLVVCADVIEHAEQPELVLTEIYRLLKPGGRLVLSTPVRLTEFPLEKEHYREYFPRELDHLLEPRFKISEHRCFISVLGFELYQYAPFFFLRRPLFRYFMNAVKLCCNINLFDRFNRNNHLWVSQAVVCIKAPE